MLGTFTMYVTFLILKMGPLFSKQLPYILNIASVRYYSLHTHMYQKNSILSLWSSDDNGPNLNMFGFKFGFFSVNQIRSSVSEEKLRVCEIWSAGLAMVWYMFRLRPNFSELSLKFGFLLEFRVQVRSYGKGEQNFCQA